MVTKQTSKQEEGFDRMIPVHSAKINCAFNLAIYQGLSYYTNFTSPLAVTVVRNESTNAIPSFAFEENKQSVHSGWLGLQNQTLLR
jgi:hypothetical protein